MLFTEIGPKLEQEVHHLWRADLHGCNDDRSGHELSVTVPGETNVEELVDGVHFLTTCEIGQAKTCFIT